MPNNICKTDEKTRTLVFAGLFALLGVLLPTVTSHAVGLPGNILLPMHIPVLTCGLVCGPWYGLACGILSPTLSSLLTGMPMAYPNLPLMICELGIYGFVSGLLFRRVKLPLLASLPLAMVSGRVAYGLALAALVGITGTAVKASSVSAAVITGLPGIAIQLVLIPTVYALLVRAGLCDYPSKEKAQRHECEARDEACRMIESGEVSCVLIKDGKVINKADGRGVRPLIQYYDNNPDMMKGALVVDRIIGRAAAMILVAGGAGSVYGLTMSRSGMEYLCAHGISCSCGRCIDIISNREGNGICPLERTVMDIEDPVEGIAALRKTIAELMAAKA